MGLIALEDIKFRAYHGVYGEEHLAGNDFVLDVYIHTPFEKAAGTDDIKDTINYETVYLICQNVMKEKVHLLETIGELIIAGLKHQFSSIQQVQVRVRKLNPFPGSRVGSSYIETEDNFVSSCPRCGKGQICYSDENCWCQQEHLFPETQEMLRSKYNGCLCKSCLKSFTG